MQNKKEIDKMLSQWFIVRGERIAGKGEDSYLLSVDSKSAIIGVFDGCGGSGARIYPVFNNQTGAYLASRIICEATYKWYGKQYVANDEGMKAQNSLLKKYIDNALAQYRKRGKADSMLSGSLSKEFPSTLAVTTIIYERKKIYADFLWSGDSRGYILDNKGLHQVTKDDLPNTDPMQNLREDAGMINVISASKPYEIHESKRELGRPCLLFTATDGCFGYYRSPMEFEKMLLDTLMQSNSIHQWKYALDQRIKAVAGDDYTMCLLAIRFRSFIELQDCFRGWWDWINKKYPLTEETTERELFQQWEEYRTNYEQY